MCCCCCCNANCCCDPFKHASVSAFMCMVQAGFFIVVNTLLLLVHSCVIPPPDDLPNFLEKPWAWFFYDNGLCLEQHGQDYIAPDYILENDIPVYFHSSSIKGAVSPGANYGYQIFYVTFHCMWVFTGLLLFYGNARKRWGYYIPWILNMVLLMIGDVVFATFYMILWGDTNPGWDDSEAFFWMIFLYFRAFAFFIFNIIQLMNVWQAFSLSYRKRTKQNRREQALRKELTQAPITTQSQINSSQQQPVTIDLHYHMPPENLNLESAEIPTPLVEEKKRKSEPSWRKRPFSYLSNVRPNSAFDVKAMKEHGTSNKTFESDMGLYPTIDYDDDQPSAPMEKHHQNYYQ